jgi:RNA polymerase sigma-54 factor
LKLRTSSNLAIKGKLSQTLRGWLPILQSDLESLKEVLDEQTKDNPFVQIKPAQEMMHSSVNKNSFRDSFHSADLSDMIDNMNYTCCSLYEQLENQITSPLFPTPKSKKIARAIINNINDDGYLDTDRKKLAKELGITFDMFEKVRLRFSRLEPAGVGAIDMHESFLFQLESLDLDDEVYKTCVKLIGEFDNLKKYQKDKHFHESLNIIKRLHNPPAIQFQEEGVQVVPDIFIIEKNNSIEVVLNNAYYPQVVIDRSGFDDEFDFVKDKIKDAASLVDALDMRKATLTKVALSIIEYQYEFFTGGAIKPMKLEDLAIDLERHHSTISRAISNKYLSCERGVFPIKSFFSLAINEDNDTSNAEIKVYIQKLIKEEDRKKPLSDNKIKTLVEKHFSVTIGRRTITKYRMGLGLVSSGDRKKLYSLEL